MEFIRQAWTLILLTIIIGILLCIANDLNLIKEERIMRVTEIKHIANIDHFYGNLPTGEIIDGTTQIHKAKPEQRSK